MSENPLLDKDENGRSFGKNPLSIDIKKLKEAGHDPKPTAKIMREKCIDCCAGSHREVAKCTVTSCPLWVYRMGKNPFLSAKHKKKTENGNSRLSNRTPEIQEPVCDAHRISEVENNQ